MVGLHSGNVLAFNGSKLILAIISTQFKHHNKNTLDVSKLKLPSVSLTAGVTELILNYMYIQILGKCNAEFNLVTSIINKLFKCTEFSYMYNITQFCALVL